MRQGFQADPIKEHAALTELAVLLAAWQRAEDEARSYVRRSIESGVRAAVICDQLGWSRATLYRWLAASEK